MTKVILDTNVVVSSLVFGGKIRTILDLVFAGELQMVSCQELEEEILRILVAKFGFSFEDMITAKKLIGVAKTHVITKPYPKISRDKDDNFLLALVSVSKTKILVTGDKDLLVLKKYSGCKIITASQFLDFLDVHLTTTQN
jgi:putative PIN family toxin of toxin-antitoxin system